MATLDRAWCVLCALTARKPAHGHGHGQKAEKDEFWRKLRHKSDCCCFGWAVYAPWACYMNLRALFVFVFKLAKCPLTCLADLAGDLLGKATTTTNGNENENGNKARLSLGSYLSEKKS